MSLRRVCCHFLSGLGALWEVPLPKYDPQQPSAWPSGWSLWWSGRPGCWTWNQGKSLRSQRARN